MDELEYENLRPEDRIKARELIRLYAASLDIDLGFQDFEKELADFPGKYQEPEGAFIVAKAGSLLCGCIGLRRLEPRICEMKRLYVLDAYKGQGVGRRLVEEILQAGQGLGYARMRLDTLSSMTQALNLYRSFGFKEIPAYTFNPIPGAIFMERDL